MKKLILFHITLMAMLSISTSFAQEKGAPFPGLVRSNGKGFEIILEEGRTLVWPQFGNLVLKNAQGGNIAEIDFNRSPKKIAGASALGLEVEEADLGGKKGGKRYLSGEKQPKGKTFNASTLKQEVEPSSKKSQSNVQGIPLQITEYENGSYELEFQWPDQTEIAFFDRRNTLIHVLTKKQQGPIASSFKQFSDGSYQRVFSSKSGEIQDTYNELDQSYRVLFSNARGEALVEVNCEKECRAEYL